MIEGSKEQTRIDQRCFKSVETLFAALALVLCFGKLSRFECVDAKSHSLQRKKKLISLCSAVSASLYVPSLWDKSKVASASWEVVFL